MPMQPIGGPLNFDTSPIAQPLTMPAPQPKKKGGMFGSGLGVGEAIVAALNGYLAAKGNPVGIANMQAFAQKRQQALEESQYQQHRGDHLADYAEMQKIQAQYGAPPAPHYFEDNSGNQMAIGPDGKPQMVYQDPNPWKLVPNGMGGVVPVNMQDLMRGMGQQAGPVGKITPIEGGPTPQASGGFPRSY